MKMARFGGALVVALISPLGFPRAAPLAAPQGPPAPAVADGGQVIGGTSPCQVEWQPQADNGIAVGEPKIFDNRSLALMLDSLNESLRSVQVIDQKSLASSLNLLQGSRVSDVARSLSVQGAPLPQVVDTTERGSETVDQATAKLEEKTGTTPGSTSADEWLLKTTASGKDTSQTTLAAQTAALPTLPELLAAPVLTPEYGLNAIDVLDNQVNLTYQIFNVRMILERALSDRLHQRRPRLQAVLGFNISLDPPRDAQGSAAVVEVTVQPGDGNATAPVSLVALMPHEKTYNSTNLSTKSMAFGGAAVARIVSVGYNERRRAQTFYLYRDSDTLAFERMNETSPTSTMFGWQFRPVLGRPSVSPGLRQMFAVVALPAGDEVPESGAFDDPQERKIAVSVRTYWRKFYRDSATTNDTVGFWPRVARIASLGIAVKSPPAADVTTAGRGCIEIPRTHEYQDQLGPVLTNIGWRQTDERNALVTLVGRNLFRGSEVRLGGSAHRDTSTGLIPKSDQTVDLTVPLTDLAHHDGVLIGRYGQSIPLEVAHGHGMRIESVSWSPRPLGGKHELDITLTHRAPGPQAARFTVDDLPPDSAPLVSLDGKLIPPPYILHTLTGGPDGDDRKVLVRAYVSVDQARNVEGILTVRFPFLGAQWKDTWRVYDPDRSYSITRFAEGDPDVSLLIEAHDPSNPFAPGWQVVLDQPYVVQTRGTRATFLQSNLIKVDVPKALLSKFKDLLLVDRDNYRIRLAIPDGKPAEPEPAALAGQQSFNVRQHDASRITIKGTQLGKVESVSADGEALESTVGPKGDTLDIYLRGVLTAKPRTFTVVLRDGAKKVIGSIDVTVTARAGTGESK